MENQTPMVPIANSQQTTVTQSTIDSEPKANNFLVILLSILLLFSVLIAGFFAYQTQKLVNELTTLKNEPAPITVLQPTLEPVVVESPVSIANPSPMANLYQDPIKKYSFSYSSQYKIVPSVPTLFDGTMLDQVKNNCRGPVLQNILDPNVLIVMEIVPASPDGSFCWSNGTFTKDDKWMVSEIVGWKGDYFVMKQVQNSTNYLGFVGLANKGTYKLKGLEDLNQILSTFKFTN